MGDAGPATVAVVDSVTICPGDSQVEGLDVALWQGTIDWSAVATADIHFAFIRVADGTDLDTRFADNWAGAHSAGLIRGPYQSFRAGQDPDAQADLLLAHATPEAGDLPPALWVESLDGQTAQTVLAGILAWSTRVADATGRTPIIYTGAYFWSDSLGDPDVSQLPLWIANYGVSCPLVPVSWSAFSFWQYSSQGGVPGIAGQVDLDVFNGSPADLAAFIGASSAGLIFTDDFESGDLAGWSTSTPAGSRPGA